MREVHGSQHVERGWFREARKRPSPTVSAVPPNTKTRQEGMASTSCGEPFSSKRHSRSFSSSEHSLMNWVFSPASSDELNVHDELLAIVELRCELEVHGELQATVRLRSELEVSGEFRAAVEATVRQGPRRSDASDDVVPA